MTEWKRCWLRNGFYKEITGKAIHPDKVFLESVLGKGAVEILIQENFNLMDKIEAVVTKYSFHVNELYRLN